MGYRIILVTVLLLTLACWPAQAAKIHLTNGRVVEGDIVTQDADHVVLDIHGIKLTYFSDEIDYIEGEKKTPGQEQAPAPQTALGSASPQQALPETPLPSEPAPAPEQPFGAYRQQTFSQIQNQPLDNMSKADLTRILIDLSGVRDNLAATFDQMIKQAPPDEAARLKKLVNIDEIVEQVVPVYDKYFSKQDLVTLVSFYRSGVGKKLLEVTPQILRDTGKAVTMYFQTKAQTMQ